MLSRLASSKTFITPSLLKSAIQHVPRRQVLRTFAEESKFKTRTERINERVTLKERIMAPAGKWKKKASRNIIQIISIFQERMRLLSEKVHWLVEALLALVHCASMA